MKGRKQTSSAVSSLAGRVLAGHEPSRDEIERLAASSLAQDERPQRRRPGRKVEDPYAGVPLDADPKHAEVQKRCRERTRDLRAGKVRGRARLGPSR